MSQLTDLPIRMQDGDLAARDALFAASYAELRRLARARLNQGGRSTVLDTTSLVHEAYLRFARAGEWRAEDRRAFLAYASRVMRSVIIDTARRFKAKRREAELLPLTSDSAPSADSADGADTILKVHDALQVLEQADARLAQVVEMRYFGGYTEREIAETLQLTERTVQRDWEKARLILAAALS